MPCNMERNIVTAAIVCFDYLYSHFVFVFALNECDTNAAWPKKKQKQNKQTT